MTLSQTTSRTAASTTPGHSQPDLQQLDAWWRAACYLAVGMIYLRDNPLLREPLRPEELQKVLNQVQAGLASGGLMRGDQLPTVRQVAVTGPARARTRRRKSRFASPMRRGAWSGCSESTTCSGSWCRASP